MFRKTDQRSWIKIEVARSKNAPECYHGLREACALPYRTVARWVEAFRAGRNESADLHRTDRPPIPQYQNDIVSALLSINLLWTVRELSVEVCVSQQTAWRVLKNWRVLGRSIAAINKQHHANGILWLPDIWQKAKNFAGDNIEGM
ncbi:hypothetical protein AVEN_28858-1 [Araneus ventricosus]|uniref:Mos1 transposase HTH domain-containing protein n=1 Tax=Araneus ventricosus TaxID=182803 RepID=A0A4Y2FKI8_ARAVE|nr:hypothetical protein AVEN_28858-1 [Araneus ventricosus]